jgi:hypothetical protein
MAFTEATVKSFLAQTVGETQTLEKAIEQRRFDLSDPETLSFVGQLLVGQVRALQYLAKQIDDLQELSS